MSFVEMYRQIPIPKDPTSMLDINQDPDLPVFKDKRIGIMLFSKKGSGVMDGEDGTASDGMDISPWDKDFNLQENADLLKKLLKTGKDPIVKKPTKDTVYSIHNKRMMQVMSKTRLGKPFYETYTIRVDKETGKVLDSDTSRTYVERPN